ncbi:MAG: hypothetical protein LBV71_20385 [Prevotella sp.]|jgi:hypothetical protein|nr:hypothetical protein [Prevotella sp.]
MLLFNTNRSNKGKKYFKKKEGVQDVVYAEKAEAFNVWFVENNKEVIQYLTVRNYFDCDVFSESYLKMYENILYTGTNVENYRYYFVRSYFTNLMANGIKQNRYCELLPHYDKADTDTQYFAELQDKQQKLEKDIFDYVYKNYSIRDFELFKMYINLKPAINYASLADITGIREHNIQRAISKIKKGVRANKEFKKRREELV